MPLKEEDKKAPPFDLGFFEEILAPLTSGSTRPHRAFVIHSSFFIGLALEAASPRKTEIT